MTAPVQPAPAQLAQRAYPSAWLSMEAYVNAARPLATTTPPPAAAWPVGITAPPAPAQLHVPAAPTLGSASLEEPAPVLRVTATPAGLAAPAAHLRLSAPPAYQVAWWSLEAPAPASLLTITSTAPVMLVCSALWVVPLARALLYVVAANRQLFS